jgi:ubiquinol-cytochrome c reductase cytochrome b subunit
VGIVLVASSRRPPPRFAHPGHERRDVPLAAVVARRVSAAAVVVGVLVVVAATTAVNPVWSYGPADPGNASAGVGAVWYLAFLDGAQRLIPPGWEVVAFDRTWTLAILVPVGVCGLYFAAAVLYPVLEGWILGGRELHLLDRPRNVPTRTAIGVAGVVFFGVLWAAAGSDLIATQFRLGIEGVVLALQLALFLGPPIAFALTRRICLGLQARDRETERHGFETGRIVRMPGGRYVEIHEPLDPARRRPPVVAAEAVMLRPDPDGRIRWIPRLRARASRWFLADRVLMPLAGTGPSGEDGGEVVVSNAG